MYTNYRTRRQNKLRKNVICVYVRHSVDKYEIRLEISQVHINQTDKRKRDFYNIKSDKFVSRLYVVYREGVWHD